MAPEHTAAAEPGHVAAAHAAHAAHAEQRWQHTLLPFMMAGLVVAALFFGWTTFAFFDRLQSELSYAKAEPYGLIDKVSATTPGTADPAYRDWAVRAALEQAALQQRFNVQVAIVKGRLWARFMGFMTGMILALTGCVFVLGKLRTEIDFQGTATGATAALKTTSPGVYLALLGTVVIGMALAVPGSVEGTDAAVYLGRAPAGTPLAVTTPPVALPASAGSGAAVSLPLVPPPFPSPFAAERPAAASRP